jgi:predicted aldo/keto reductase-like oxidoreductase
MEQLEENMQIYRRQSPTHLTEKEQEIISKVSYQYNHLIEYALPDANIVCLSGEVGHSRYY